MRNSTDRPEIVRESDAVYDVIVVVTAGCSSPVLSEELKRKAIRTVIYKGCPHLYHTYIDLLTSTQRADAISTDLDLSLSLQETTFWESDYFIVLGLRWNQD